jgi:hypothetical protein
VDVRASRIVDDAEQGEVVAVPRVVFGQRGQIASRDAISPQITELEMGGGNRQGASLPFCGRKALPGVSRVLRWVRAAIEIDDAML